MFFSIFGNCSMKTKTVTLGSFIKDSVITEYGWKYISNLSRTVAYRYYKTYDIEDLVSMSITDLADFLILLEKGGDDIRSIRNVLFTRARNAMSNYLYHHRKAVPTEDEVLDTHTSKEYLSKDMLYKFTSLEEAHLLSLRLWRLYLGSREYIIHNGNKEELE